MRIGIDARELSGRATGVGRYLRGLLEEWSAAGYARRHEFVLYSAEPLGVALDARRFPTHIVGGPGGTWWEQVSLPKIAARDHLDVFFAPAYTAPLLPRLPTVVAVHDLSFAAHPEWFTMREGVRRRWFTRHAAQHARAVLTISEFSRRELIERLGVAESRIHVVPPGIHAPARSPGPKGDGVSRNALNSLNILNILYVGSIFNRRHLPDLIRAFAPISRAHTHVSLDLVGDNRSFPREDIERTITIEAPGGRARWHRYIGDDELSALYGAARVFAFLSEYEGLGLTPLEALAAGVPAVLVDTPVARESCGDAALYVASGDIAATTRALERLLFDDAARQSLLAAAPETLSRYSWPRAARETLAVLEAAD
jgi:glycosyltransferase involved in cell wall biosynthesis